jgi:hypothetical protein
MFGGIVSLSLIDALATNRTKTNDRSIYYGSGHLIPAFHGIERTFSWLLSLRLDALLGQ